MVPIELRDDPDEPGAAEAYVVATVAGREYQLILDTGGARSTLPLDGLTSTFARVDVDDEPGRGALGAASADAARAVVPSLALGPLEMRDLVVDLAPEGSDAPTILGLDVRQGHRLELRLDGAMLGSTRARPPTPSARSRCRRDRIRTSSWGGARSRRRPCSTPARAPRSSTPRSPRSIPSCSRRCPRRPAPTRPATALTAMARMAAREVGWRRFDASLATVVPLPGIQQAGDPEFDLILGVPVIRQADWIIDLARGVWAFADKRSSGRPRCTPAHRWRSSSREPDGRTTFRR